MFCVCFFFQEKKGFVFESDTDTEVIAKLAKHVHDTYAHDGSFREVVEIVIHQLVSIVHQSPGPEVRKLTTLLVNVLLKFQF